MATNIFNYNGTKLTSVPDGRMDTTSASIRFPGYGYLNYGEAVNENMLWIMQNFAASSPPSQPVEGQTWFDTTAGILKIYANSVWDTVGSVIQQGADPGPQSSPGVLWFNTSTRQLYVWSGYDWLLAGPLGALANNDPVNPAIPPNSAFDAIRISDGSANHSAWRITISGQIFAIMSRDSEYVPNPSIPGFSSIKPGINFNSSIFGLGIQGDLSLFRNNQDNVPLSDNSFSLGTSSFRFSSVYADSFVGKATSAANADAAIASQSSLVSENSNKLGGIDASIYLRSNADAIPDTNNTRDLGSSAKQWKTIYASNVLINGSPLQVGSVSSVSGTPNQVIVGGTSSVVLGLPQDIAAASTPRFSAIGLSTAAGPAGSVTFGDGTVQTTAAGSARSFNLNVQAPPGNINLAIGNKMILAFSNLVNVPLYTACTEGLYRVLLVCTSTDSQNVDLQWFPNSDLFPASIPDNFETTGILTDTTTGTFDTTAKAQNVIKPGAFWFDTVIGPGDPVASRGPFMAEFLASTYTVAKMIKASTGIALGVSINNSMWLNGVGAGSGSARLNTTTPWTSLGVIRLEPAASIGTLMSGSVTIERIA